MAVAWDELVFNSPYLAVVTAKQLLQEGQMTEAYNVLESLDHKRRFNGEKYD